MSLQFKKPQKKNLRQRLEEDGDPEEQMDVDEPISIVKKDKKKKKKEKLEAEKPKPKTLLSFDEDLNEGDDGEVFQVRKSSQSKKLMRQLDKERKRRKDQDKGPNSSNGNSIMNIKQEPPSPPSPPAVTQIVTHVNEEKKKKPLILNGREAEFARQNSESDEEDGENELPRFSKPKQLKQVLESGCIPDAAMIHAARKSRQKAREMGTDYIPVEDNKSDASKSRLDQEDEHDISDEEGEGEESLRDGKRMDFTVDTTAKEQERRREAFFAAQDEGGEESDQEEDALDSWETQQIRKAVTNAQLAAAQQEVLQQQAVSMGYMKQRHQRPMLRMQVTTQPAITMKKEPAAEQVLAQMPIKSEAPTPDELARLLRDRLTSLKETQRRHVQERERALNDLLDIADEREKLEQSQHVRTERFQFYQDLRGYVTDLVECFNEKMPVLEQLEHRSLALLSRRSSQLVQRRRQDVKDQAAEAAEMTRPAGAPAAPPDETRVRRAAEREGRRSRRRRARESKIPPGTETTPLIRHFEGLSSDDEQSELDITSFRTQTEQLERDAELVLEDVIDDFSTIQGLMTRFEEWKKFDIDSYQEAYVHLALPKLFSPLIRLNLITWNPLEENSPTFEGYKWFQNLALYGLNDAETEEMLTKDPDINLIPLVIEMAVLPKIAKVIVEVWDPCSTIQTQRLSVLLRHILHEFPQLAARGRVSKSLLPALADKLRDAIDNDVFIPIYPSRPAAAVGLYFQRQFWSAVKLLRNILLFRAIIGDNTLQDITMTALLGRYLLAALRTCEPLDALEKSRHILATIPRAWLVKEPQLIQLQMFSKQIENIIKAIDVSVPGGRDAFMEALAILKSLGARTKAEELGNIYL